MARSPVTAAKKMVPGGICLSVEEWKIIKQRAQDADLTVSDVLRKLVQAGMSETPAQEPDPNTVMVKFQPTLLQLLHASASTNNKSITETINDKLKWSYGI